LSATCARGEQDDRQHRPGAPDLLEDIDPAAARQHHVEDHEIVAALERAVLALRAIARNVHVVALRAQRPLDEVGDPALILDQKDPHREIVRSAVGDPSR
jgi:hypothetical protein